MAGLNLRLDVKGLGLSQEKLNHFEKKGGNLRRPLDIAGQYLVSEIQNKFSDNKIKPETEKFGINSDGILIKGQTLINRGHLMQSITYHVSSSNNTVEVGTNLVYAAIHQFGGWTGRNHASFLPQRDFLSISKQNINEIKKIFISHIKKI